MIKIIIILTLVLIPLKAQAGNEELINYCAVNAEYHKSCKAYGDNFAWGDRSNNYSRCCQSQVSYNLKYKPNE